MLNHNTLKAQQISRTFHVGERFYFFLYFILYVFNIFIGSFLFWLSLLLFSKNRLAFPPFMGGAMVEFGHLMFRHLDYVPINLSLPLLLASRSLCSLSPSLSFPLPISPSLPPSLSLPSHSQSLSFPSLPLL